MGILKLNLVKIFECFYCVDKVWMCKLGGIGLGFVIVKEIIEVYDGCIWVDS